MAAPLKASEFVEPGEKSIDESNCSERCDDLQNYVYQSLANGHFFPAIAPKVTGGIKVTTKAKYDAKSGKAGYRPNGWYIENWST